MLPDLQLATAGVLNEDWLELEKGLGFRPAIDLKATPIAEVREAGRVGALQLEKSFPPRKFEGVRIEDKYIPTSDGDKIQVRVYHPKEASEGKKLPVIVYFHGGGWVLGDIESDDAFCQNVAAVVKAVVVNVGYRLAPEHPFPTPVEDCFTSVLWTYDNISHLGGDSSRVYVAGTSAGGNLATVMVRKLRDSGRKERLAGQFLRIPVTCHPDVFPAPLSDPSSSYKLFADAPILSTKTMDDFWEIYDVGSKSSSLDCSPLLADEFREFPPTYISVSGCDPLRDQGIEYAKKLDEAGIPVKIEIYPGYPHGHVMWPPLKGYTESVDSYVEGIKWGVELSA